MYAAPQRSAPPNANVNLASEWFLAAHDQAQRYAWAEALALIPEAMRSPAIKSEILKVADEVGPDAVLVLAVNLGCSTNWDEGQTLVRKLPNLHAELVPIRVAMCQIGTARFVEAATTILAVDGFARVSLLFDLWQASRGTAYIEEAKRLAMAEVRVAPNPNIPLLVIEIEWTNRIEVLARIGIATRDRALVDEALSLADRLRPSGPKLRVAAAYAAIGDFTTANNLISAVKTRTEIDNLRLAAGFARGGFIDNAEAYVAQTLKEQRLHDERGVSYQVGELAKAGLVDQALQVLAMRKTRYTPEADGAIAALMQGLAARGEASNAARIAVLKFNKLDRLTAVCALAKYLATGIPDGWLADSK